MSSITNQTERFLNDNVGVISKNANNQHACRLYAVSNNQISDTPEREGQEPASLSQVRDRIASFIRRNPNLGSGARSNIQRINLKIDRHNSKLCGFFRFLGIGKIQRLALPHEPTRRNERTPLLAPVPTPVHTMPKITAESIIEQSPYTFDITYHDGSDEHASILKRELARLPRNACIVESAKIGIGINGLPQSPKCAKFNIEFNPSEGFYVVGKMFSDLELNGKPVTGTAKVPLEYAIPYTISRRGEKFSSEKGKQLFTFTIRAKV